ncbi:hypothetical protein [Micromonospora sp. NPDC005299]|uniref:hypothetical protein n=1 Tax=Micromonospora sp. NPDC005299 TaxID=3364231 RepID=UPI00367BD6A5
MPDEYLTDDEGRIASLGLAALTAYINDDAVGTARLINDPSAGPQNAINGLLVTASVLLHRLSKATGQPEEDILQELGVAYAERDPDASA